MINQTEIIFKQSKKDRQGFSISKPSVESIPLTEYIDPELLKTREPMLPELSEPQVVRHFTNLSVKNHHVDKDFYPLGSCTMKYNPKINDKIASFPSFLNVR